MKKRLGLIYGGKSAEHEVSLSTARAVMQAVDFDKYEVIPVYITYDGEWRKGQSLAKPVETIEELRLKGNGESQKDSIHQFINGAGLPDIVFPLLHGTNGEDGTVQGLFEVLNIPYVGNGVLASSAGMDKITMKQLFAQVGLKQVPYVYFNRSNWKESRDAFIAEVEEALQWPVFVKPANLGSSVGISKAADREEFIEAVDLALKFDRRVIVEEGVDAREVEVSVKGNDDPVCSVSGEIKPVTDFYDYDAKYKDGNTELIIPAAVTKSVQEEMEDMAIRAFKVLDCAGLVRADFFVTADDEVLINEVNTMPGFTPTSMFPLLWKNSGVAYSTLIDELIELALERHAEKAKIQYTMD
ncbi:D-alanine--D-alanine ligase [Sporosarcina ureilytica]|uniref:D-alanine--D-alanine ligase n=1 Tax=Sporosarcina ureilytica TaxID=298596 RepID=A0A1D8JD90_9BACL|nr:D-alanine--D-alanine ligase [Sporosarcina ureilytica]AOV06664.1 D-alanine--D-alanine ligase A [Sporosarcina ureilytica]